MEIDGSDFEHLLNQFNTPEAPVHKAVDYAIRNHQSRKQIGGTFLKFLDSQRLDDIALENVLQFATDLCRRGARESCEAYPQFLRLHLCKVLDVAVPEQAMATDNFERTDKFLSDLQGEAIIDHESALEYRQYLRNRGVPGIDTKRPVEFLKREDMNEQGSDDAVFHASEPFRLDKRALIQRIENDRDMWKKQREDEWRIVALERDEYDEQWEETGSLSSTDFRFAQAEDEKRHYWYSSKLA